MICFIIFSVSQCIDPKEPRANLTVRVTVLTNETDDLNIGGDGTWFDKPKPLLKKVGPHTWQFDIHYSSDLEGFTCHNCPENAEHVHTGDQVYIQIFTNKSQVPTPMIGPKTKIKFPVSASSSYFKTPPEIVITPNFDNREGSVHSFKATHPIFGERDIGVYLPPGYVNPHKKFPVTIMMDVTSGWMLVGKPLFDTWFSGSVRETVILGFGDWHKIVDDPKRINDTDRGNLLTPVVGDSFVCKNGTIYDQCGGCEVQGDKRLETNLRCFDTVVGGQGGGADMLLDWLLGDILLQIVQMWPDRLLIDRDNLGIVGYSLGGLFSCHAAWTRQEMISRAACESSSFWWPTNAKLVSHMFHFVNQTMKQFTRGRLPQRILVTVGADEQTADDDFQMVKMAEVVVEEMVKLPVFKKDENVWLQVYPNTNHSAVAWVERLGYSLKIIWG